RDAGLDSMDRCVAHVRASQQPLGRQMAGKPVAIRGAPQFCQAFLGSEFVICVDATKPPLVKEQLLVEVAFAIERHRGKSYKPLLRRTRCFLFSSLAGSPNVIESKSGGLSSYDQLYNSLAGNQTCDSHPYLSLGRHGNGLC